MAKKGLNTPIRTQSGVSRANQGCHTRGTLTLGQDDLLTARQRSSRSLRGCAWRPEGPFARVRRRRCRYRGRCHCHHHYPIPSPPAAAQRAAVATAPTAAVTAAEAVVAVAAAAAADSSCWTAKSCSKSRCQRVAPWREIWQGTWRGTWWEATAAAQTDGAPPMVGGPPKRSYSAARGCSLRHSCCLPRQLAGIARAAVPASRMVRVEATGARQQAGDTWEMRRCPMATSHFPTRARPPPATQGRRG